ncbi:MAG: hypothetical protein LC720_04460 [Actinobacteria bacterium]|nr:hypothetical protein [Actinomycetota bacterium]
MGGVGFTEEMAGWLSFEETDFNQALLAGRRARRTALVHLRIEIDDLDAFIADPNHPASATGWLECGELGGRLPIDDGRFELFVEAPDPFHLRMRYRLFARTPAGPTLTLVGFKLVENDLGSDHWADQTTLFTRVYAGRVEAEPPGGELGPELVATGVLRIPIRAFLRQLTTYRATAPTRSGRRRNIARFQAFFLSKLMLAYAGAPVHGLPSFPRDLPAPAVASDWEPVQGRPGLARRVVPHTTDDGVALKLDHLRRDDLPEPTRGPVLVSHGAGLRGQMYYAQPSGRTLVDALLETGYDVWVQHWRGSIDLPTVSWTLDEVARYDHPAAVRTVLAETRSPTLKAVVHCQGSVSFTMAAAAGLVPEVTEVVATGVSLHIRVPVEAAEKHVMVPALSRLTPWIDAQWAVRAITLQGQALARLGAMTPFEQRLSGVLMHRLAAFVNRRANPAPAHPAQAPPPAVHPGYRGAAGPEHPVCRMANFMYGAGADVLWRGENVTREIHDWMGRELGSSPLSLFGQIRASAVRGHVAPAVALDGMPDSYVAAAPRTRARFTFVVGAANRMFLPSGMRATYEHFDRHAPDAGHAFVELDGFGHLDIYFGGDTVEITLGEVRRTVVVRALAERRGPAVAATLLYAETPASVAAREHRAAEARFARPPGADAGARPTKRDRRRIDAARARG